MKGVSKMICKKCGNYFKSRIIIDGKERNLSTRKYCLVCSPFKSGNTKKLENCENGIKPFLCSICGETNPENFYSGKRKNGTIKRLKSMCKKCHGKYTWDRKRKYKEVVVKEFGGKCSICGYSKCISALEFHHSDFTKDNDSWRKKRNRGIEYYREQVKECVLVCANCHREIHSERIN